MNAKDRVLLSLNHHEPDRVPLIFGAATPGFEDKWMSLNEDRINEDDIVMFGGHDLTLPKQMGFDTTWAWIFHGILKPQNPNHKIIKNQNLKPSQFYRSDGRIMEKGLVNGRIHEWYVGPGLNSIELWHEWFDNLIYTPFDSKSRDDTQKQYNAAINSPNGGILPIIPLDPILESLTESIGLGTFAKAYRKQKPLLISALDKLLTIRKTQLKNILSVGVDVVVICDDSAYKDRTYISPAMHRELVVPCYRELAEECHRSGVKFILHSDGYTEPYFPGYIEAGIDGICTIETAAGMDMAKLKQDYGQDLAFMGPIDCSLLLSFGTSQEIEQAIIKLIQDGAKGGGFIMGPCTSLLDSISLENAYLMVEKTKEHGIYPIF